MAFCWGSLEFAKVDGIFETLLVTWTFSLIARCFPSKRELQQHWINSVQHLGSNMFYKASSDFLWVYRRVFQKSSICYSLCTFSSVCFQSTLVVARSKGNSSLYSSFKSNIMRKAWKNIISSIKPSAVEGKTLISYPCTCVTQWVIEVQVPICWNNCKHTLIQMASLHSYWLENFAINRHKVHFRCNW